jgi:hypothetical protein
MSDEELAEIKAAQWQFTKDNVLAQIRTKRNGRDPEAILKPATYRFDPRSNQIEIQPAEGQAFKAFYGFTYGTLAIEVPRSFLLSMNTKQLDDVSSNARVVLSLIEDDGAVEFDYPEAKDKSETISNSRVYPRRMLTSDDIDKVRTWYEKKLGIEHDADLGHTGTRANLDQGIVSEVANDSTNQANGVTTPRPVKVYILLRDCPRYWLHVVLTRAESEQQTHVLVTYVMK